MFCAGIADRIRVGDDTTLPRKTEYCEFCVGDLLVVSGLAHVERSTWVVSPRRASPYLGSRQLTSGWSRWMGLVLVDVVDWGTSGKSGTCHPHLG